MTLWFSGALKVVAMMLVALGALGILRRRSAAVRHALLSIAVLCALGMPIVQLAVPGWRVPTRFAWLTRPISAPTTAVLEVPPPGAASPAAPVTQVMVPTDRNGSLWIRVAAATWITGT